MDTEEYYKKMNNLLDVSAYKPTARNPTTYLEKITKAKIHKANLYQETKQTLIEVLKCI